MNTAILFIPLNANVTTEKTSKGYRRGPSVVLSKELRTQMGEAAVNVAKSCDYRGAGTVIIFEPGVSFISWKEYMFTATI